MSGAIVVACDGRSPATLRLGVLLARTLEREILLATAYRYEPVALGAAPLPPLAADRRREAAEQTIDRLLATVPDDVRATGRVVPATTTAEALTDLAAEVDAPVLVVGPDERARVTEDALGRARCPVAVAPGDPLLVPDRLERIGAAFDGSEMSHLAATAAARLGLCAEAPVTLIGVTADERERDALEGEARGELSRDRQELTLELRTGDPGVELRRASATLDVLVCGSRGRGRVARTLLGSVSHALVAQPPCAVIVVGPHAKHDPAGPLGLTAAGRP